MFPAKKASLLLILILSSCLVHGQNGYQITDTTKKWNTLTHGSGSWNVKICGGTKMNIFQGQYIINDTAYFNVYECRDSLQQDWSHVGYIREDTVSKKVFFTEWHQDFPVGLLYDFNLQVGDSAIINNYYKGLENVLLICDSIDSLNINGLQKKRLFLFTPNSWRTEIWIEGIGSQFGLLYSGLAAYGWDGADLLCCTENDTLIYFDSLYNSCYIEAFYPKIVSEFYDTAYVNNFYEFQLIISDTNNIDSFALIGASIPEGFEFDVNTGLLTGTPTTTGSFGCIIQTKNCDLGFLTDMLYADIVVELETTVQNANQKGDINIYPNPFRSTFHIINQTNSEVDYYLEIYNIFGELTSQKTINKLPFKLECNHYKSGMYFLKMTDINQKVIKTDKLIKK